MARTGVLSLITLLIECPYRNPYSVNPKSVDVNVYSNPLYMIDG